MNRKDDAHVRPHLDDAAKRSAHAGKRCTQALPPVQRDDEQTLRFIDGYWEADCLV